MFWVNLVVASSNLVAFWFGWRMPWYNQLRLALPATASILYHLSETKHGLTSIYPLTLFTNKLLWLDRFFAVAAGLVVLSKFNTTSTALRVWMGVGLGLLLYSERDMAYSALFSTPVPWWCRVNPRVFALTHSLWHGIAFYILSRVLTLLSF